MTLSHIRYRGVRPLPRLRTGGVVARNSLISSIVDPPTGREQTWQSPNVGSISSWANERRMDAELDVASLDVRRQHILWLVVL